MLSTVAASSTTKLVAKAEIDELYVARSGKDEYPGTKSRPFATLERAKLAVRDRKGKSAQPITVWVQEGTYYLDQTFVLGPDDSGTSEQPIAYSAAPGASVTVSGAKLLSCDWKSYRDGIFVSDLPTLRKNPPFTQLFVNRKRQIRARYPNADDSEPGKSGYLTLTKDAPDWPATSFQFDPNTFTDKRWKHAEEAILHIFPKNYWGNLQWRVKGVDWSTSTVSLGQGGFQLNEILQGRAATKIGIGSRYFIENVFEELDAPGEWYWDRREGRLYYKPEIDVDLYHAIIEASHLKRLIEFRGSQQKPVQHITISGFRLAGTETTYLDEYEAPSLGDWTIHRGGAVYLEGAENCTIQNCFFDAVGGNAVMLSDYTRGVKVSGNKFTKAGDSAICLVGSRNRAQGAQRPYPANNVVSNNLIHDCGKFGKQTAGVFISNAEQIEVNHNHIYTMPRAGICLNDVWRGGHIIEYNHIHDTVRETGDHGSFNSWGRERYWCLMQSHGGVSHAAGDVKSYTAIYTNVIRYNVFQDYRGWGIDLDDGSSNFEITNNLCIGVSIKLREGDLRTVENNIFVHPVNPPGFHVGYEDNRDCFRRNIIVMNSKFDRPEVDVNFKKGRADGQIYQCIYPPERSRILSEIDFNVFFSDTGEFRASVLSRGRKETVYSLKDWQALGYDQHSLYADPMFVDPTKGDYRLSSGSPAYRVGFKAFDSHAAGLLPNFPSQWRDTLDES